jgi:hypothetical protein
MYVAIFPLSLLWRAAKHLVAPAADITMNRWLIGKVFWLLGKSVIPVTRKRDDSWQDFLASINPETSFVVILPEGRMMRRNGQDKHGKDMNIRSGIIEVLDLYEEGQLLILTSGGLHHIHHPGQLWPKMFKTIKARVELFSLNDFKSSYVADDAKSHSRENAINRKRILSAELEKVKARHLQEIKALK